MNAKVRSPARRQPSKPARPVFAIIIVWILVATLGRKLPYVDYWFFARSSVVFGLLYGALFIALYIKPTGAQGKSAMRGYLATINGWQRRILSWIIVSGIAVIIPAGFAMTSASFPALATQVFAGNAYVGMFVFEGFDSWRGAGGNRTYRLVLVDSQGRRAKLTVRRNTQDVTDWRPGDALCLHGRSWALGTVVESINRDGSCGL